MTAILQIKCPACDVILDYEVSSAGQGRTEAGDATVTVRVQTTPESTEHVWTHAPQD